MRLTWGLPFPYIYRKGAVALSALSDGCYAINDHEFGVERSKDGVMVVHHLETDIRQLIWMWQLNFALFVSIHTWVYFEVLIDDLYRRSDTSIVASSENTYLLWSATVVNDLDHTFRTFSHCSS